jgi:hypothetical protein
MSLEVLTLVGVAALTITFPGCRIVVSFFTKWHANRVLVIVIQRISLLTVCLPFCTDGLKQLRNASVWSI